MTCPGPIARATRMAAATLMPAEPPIDNPSCCSRSNTCAKASASRYAHRVVDRSAVEISRHAALADAFGDRTALDDEIVRLDPAIEPAAVGVGEHDPHRGVTRLQGVGHARKRAAGAAGAGEGVDAPGGLRPDLRARRRRMARTVGAIVELVRVDGPELVSEPPRDMDVVAGIAERLCRHEAKIGADHAQDVDLLLALRLRHHHDGPVAARIGDQRDADAGVAGGALDDRAAGLEDATFLGVEDDRETGAVLYRTARVHELGLAENGAAGRLRRAPETNERRVADGARQPIGHARQCRPRCPPSWIDPCACLPAP